MKTNPNFDAKLRSFFDGVVKISDEHFAKDFPTLKPNVFTYSYGNRYVRIDTETSVFCFVDQKDGSVLKPASYKAPAKHARGNIFAEDNGLGCINPYGVAYLSSGRRSK